MQSYLRNLTSIYPLEFSGFVQMNLTVLKKQALWQSAIALGEIFIIYIELKI